MARNTGREDMEWTGFQWVERPKPEGQELLDSGLIRGDFGAKDSQRAMDAGYTNSQIGAALALRNQQIKEADEARTTSVENSKGFTTTLTRPWDPNKIKTTSVSHDPIHGIYTRQGNEDAVGWAPVGSGEFVAMSPQVRQQAQAAPATAQSAAAPAETPKPFDLSAWTQSGGDEEATEGTNFASLYVNRTMAGATDNTAQTATPDYDAFLQRKEADDAAIRQAEEARTAAAADTQAQAAPSPWEPGERGRIEYAARETRRAGELAARPLEGGVPESRRFADAPEFRQSLKEREEELNRTYGNLFS
jgi:hypothetical protein